MASGSTFSTNPNYIDLVRDFVSASSRYYAADTWGNYSFPQSFFDDLRKYYQPPTDEYWPVVLIALLFTVVRYAFELIICKPLINCLKIDSKTDREKLPESLWKTLTYTFTWLWCYDLLLWSGKYGYFTEPWKIWDDWTLGMSIPSDIKWIYIIECGFYFHSIYATLYMDTKRKDFAVMLVHHVLTLILLIFSYVMRYHKIGLLVIFVHDVTDIVLEFTKCNVYLKNRGGKYYPLHDHISNIGFVLFTIAWFMFRLFWFPLKILYSTSVVAVYTAQPRGAGLYWFNILIWMLLLLDIYWFYFILNFLYKVATGQVNTFEDTREYEEDSAKPKKTTKTKKAE